MPGSAHYGDAFPALLLRGPNGFAHERFAQNFAPRFKGIGQRRCFRPHGGQRFGNRGEQVLTILTLLDRVFPPLLAAAVTRCLPQPAQRVMTEVGFIPLTATFPKSCCGEGRFDSFPFFSQRQRMGLRQVHELHRNALPQGVANRLPFGREFGEGVKRRIFRRFRGIE